MDQSLTIVTHSSKFHSDDIFGVATLLLVFEKEYLVHVVRSRDAEIISKANIVVDVGFVYDPMTDRFDHHQSGGAGVRDNTVPYASFGLVWKKYGKVLCGGNENLVQTIDTILVQPIDAYDNGIAYMEPKIPGLYNFDLRSLLYAFRPTWKENKSLDDLFMQLVSYAKVIIERQIVTTRDNLEAVSLVEQAYASAPDKRIVSLDERYPWEDVLKKFPEPLYVVYPKRVDNTWSLKTVSDDFRTYVNRKDLPQSWAGKTGKDLEEITGVPGSIFCHNRRFLAVAKTKEAILKLAEIALNS